VLAKSNQNSIFGKAFICCNCLNDRTIAMQSRRRRRHIFMAARKQNPGEALWGTT
jgi:hypothetical protein